MQLVRRFRDESQNAFVTTSPSAVEEFGIRLAALGWVSDLLVGGRWRPVTTRLASATSIWSRSSTGRSTRLDRSHSRICTVASTAERPRVSNSDASTSTPRRSSTAKMLHPTWTHGSLVQRILSGIARAELVRDGYAVFGRSPRDVLPTMIDDDVREAARAELAGYWTWAARRPCLWLDPVIADLGLTSMAGGRFTLATDELLSKTRAVEQVDAPAWLIDQLRARRRGENLRSPRVRTALIAWRDVRRTVARVKSRPES